MRREMLAEAIQSVLDQYNFENLITEIIVSDNSGTKYAEDVVNQFKNQKIKYRSHTPSTDFRQHWIDHISLCSGKWCAILCDDDIWMPWHLTEAKRIILASGATMYFSSKIHSNSTSLRFGIVESSPFLTSEGQDFTKIDYGRACVDLLLETSCMLSCLVYYVDPKINFHEVQDAMYGMPYMRGDAALFLAVLPISGFVYNHRPTVFYRRHEAQVQPSMEDRLDAEKTLQDLIEKYTIKHNIKVTAEIQTAIESGKLECKIYAQSNWWRLGIKYDEIKKPLGKLLFLKLRIAEFLDHHRLSNIKSKLARLFR